MLNIHAAPARVSRRVATDGPTAMYSPTQVLVAAFFGGPLALVYTLHANFLSMGDRDNARWTLLWGGALTLVALFLVIVVDFPGWAITAGFLAIGRTVTETMQISGEAIAASPLHTGHSNGRVVGVVMLSLLGWLFLSFVVAFLAVMGGVVSP